MIFKTHYSIILTSALLSMPESGKESFVNRIPSLPKLLLQEAVTLSYYDWSRDRSAKQPVVVGVEVCTGRIFLSRPGPARMATISARPGPNQRKKFRHGPGTARKKN